MIELCRNDFSNFMFSFFPCPLPRDHICDQKKDLLQQFAVFVKKQKKNLKEANENQIKE